MFFLWYLLLLDISLFFFCWLTHRYEGGVHDRFPDGGKLSQHLASLKVGDELVIQGPFGLITYHGKGNFSNGRKKVKAKHLGMIAGGTGLTPMLQIIEDVLKTPGDETRISLLFGNQEEKDILLRDSLEALQEHFGEERFKVHTTTLLN